MSGSDSTPSDFRHRAGRYLPRPNGYKRNRVFRYAPYIAIFSDNAPDASVDTKESTA